MAEVSHGSPSPLHEKAIPGDVDLSDVVLPQSSLRLNSSPSQVSNENPQLDEESKIILAQSISLEQLIIKENNKYRYYEFKEMEFNNIKWMFKPNSLLLSKAKQQLNHWLRDENLEITLLVQEIMSLICSDIIPEQFDRILKEYMSRLKNKFSVVGSGSQTLNRLINTFQVCLRYAKVHNHLIYFKITDCSKVDTKETPEKNKKTKGEAKNEELKTVIIDNTKFRSDFTSDSIEFIIGRALIHTILLLVLNEFDNQNIKKIALKELFGPLNDDGVDFQFTGRQGLANFSHDENVRKIKKFNENLTKFITDLEPEIITFILSWLISSLSSIALIMMNLHIYAFLNLIHLTITHLKLAYTTIPLAREVTIYWEETNSKLAEKYFLDIMWYRDKKGRKIVKRQILWNLIKLKYYYETILSKTINYGFWAIIIGSLSIMSMICYQYFMTKL